MSRCHCVMDATLALAVQSGPRGGGRIASARHGRHTPSQERRVGRSTRSTRSITHVVIWHDSARSGRGREVRLGG